MSIRIIGPKDKKELQAINTTSSSSNWSKGLSPFLIGPVNVYNEIVSKNLENAWQYSKVYPGYVDEKGNPSNLYWEWAIKGWSKKFADRYPMGKNEKPLYCFFSNEKLGYIEARKKVYLPLYQREVQKTQAYKNLKEIYNKTGSIVLFDFDGYDYKRIGLSLKDVLNNSERKMGHAFVLAMMLTYGDNFTIEDL